MTKQNHTLRQYYDTFEGNDSWNWDLSMSFKMFSGRIPSEKMQKYKQERINLITQHNHCKISGFLLSLNVHLIGIFRIVFDLTLRIKVKNIL